MNTGQQEIPRQRSKPLQQGIEVASKKSVASISRYAVCNVLRFLPATFFSRFETVFHHFQLQKVSLGT